jgi:hypothetical protein
MINVIILNADMLDVAMLGVVAPFISVFIYKGVEVMELNMILRQIYSLIHSLINKLTNPHTHI